MPNVHHLIMMLFNHVRWHTEDCYMDDINSFVRDNLKRELTDNLLPIMLSLQSAHIVTLRS